MSFILEALKKSARERKRGDIPTLEANHQTEYDLHFSTPAGGSTVKWIIISLTVVLPVFVIGAWYGQKFFPQKTEIEDSQDLTTTTKLNQPKNQKTKDIPTNSFENIGRENSSPTIIDSGPAEKAHQDPLMIKQPYLKTKKIQGTVTNNQTDLNNKEQDKTAPLPAKPLDKAPPLLKYLPEKLRDEIPEIKFAGHAYSDDPSRRMIIINQKIVREKDVIAPNLQLLTISPTGMVLRYNSTSFRIEMFKQPAGSTHDEL